MPYMRAVMAYLDWASRHFSTNHVPKFGVYGHMNFLYVHPSWREHNYFWLMP